MYQEILSLNLFAFLLIFVRIGAFFFVAPGFSGSQISLKIRLSIALAFTLVLTPTLADSLPHIPGHPLSLAALIVGEFTVGIFIGTICRILFSAIHVAASITSFVSSMANAMIDDPISQQQSAIIASFLSVLVTVLLFVTNLHHVMLQAMIDSYSLFRPGVLPNAGDMSELISHHVAGAFKLGIQLAFPMIIIAFAYYVGLGILTRLEPNVPIFFVGMPLQIVLGITTLMITVSSISLYFLDRFEKGMQPFLLS